MWRRMKRAMGLLSAGVAVTLVPQLAWAHGQGVGLVVGGLSGALPALVVGVVHLAVGALRLEADKRRAVLARTAGATVVAIVLSFALHGLAERYTRDLSWLLSAVLIDLGLCALVAWPLVRAQYDAEHKTAARALMIGSLLAPCAIVLALLATLSRG
jgi:hypothetical protein